MVFISHGQDVLWSQEACWKCIFQGSGDSNVKISSFTAHHGGASGDTDLANSKETQSLRKYGCRQKCLDKSLVWLDRTPGVNYEEKLHNQLLILFKNVDFLLLICLHPENQSQISIQSRDIKDSTILKSGWLRACFGISIPK